MGHADGCLASVADHGRFLFPPNGAVPDHGSAVLSCVLAQLSGGWQARYGHPVLLVETAPPFLISLHFNPRAPLLLHT
jgi:hypothetical protein